ncbi:MAG: carboxypeptidase regulatory-like domain-containing protein, partial [Planctomycetaceae bacterium]
MAHRGVAQYPWLPSILIGTLLACGASGMDAPAVSLDPPLNHWLYQLPEADQTALVSVTVQVQDEQGKPVSKTTVLVHCLPWHYVCKGTADETGQVVLRGPLGDWTVYAGQPGYVAVERNVVVAGDCKIIVASENRTTLRFMDLLPPEMGQEVSRARCAVALDLEDIPTPSSSRLNIGNTQNGTLGLSSAPGIKGRLWITRDASADQSGLALCYPYDTTQPASMPCLDSGLSELRIHFDGFGEKIRTVINFTNLDQVCHTGYVAYYVPPEGGEATIRVTPGNYRLDATVMPGAGVVYLSQPRRFEANGVYEFSFGSAFTAQPRVLTWNRNQLHLWFDILDNYRNNLLQVPSDDAHVRLTQDEHLIYEGPTYESRSRHVRLDLDWEPYWQKESPISYEYRISSAATGNVHVTGTFPSDPNIALGAGNLPITYQSDHFEFRLLDMPAERGQRLAEGLETALQWLFTNYAGPVSPANRERWPLESKSPVGVGWSGGSQFSVNVYAGSLLEPYLPEGNTFVLFHELGHCYQASPPHHQARA